LCVNFSHDNKYIKQQFFFNLYQILDECLWWLETQAKNKLDFVSFSKNLKFKTNIYTFNIIIVILIKSSIFFGGQKGHSPIIKSSIYIFK
jgi:hypothetical protein